MENKNDGKAAQNDFVAFGVWSLSRNAASLVTPGRVGSFGPALALQLRQLDAVLLPKLGGSCVNSMEISC
jgi:hypothetical protein